MANRIGTHAMWIATFVGSRWYAPYCMYALAQSRPCCHRKAGRCCASTRTREREPYKDEVLFQIKDWHVGFLKYLCDKKVLVFVALAQVTGRKRVL